MQQSSCIAFLQSADYFATILKRNENIPFIKFLKSEYQVETTLILQAPVPAPAPGVVASQYHAQDEFGNVIYGYNNPNSAKTEQRDAYGNVVGAYSYNDGTGYPKHVSYVADDFGFRITAANNLPVAHV